MSKFARRIDQLDAIYLDEELLSLLNNHYRKSFQYLPNSWTVFYGPEFDILFRFLFRYLPLHFLGCTFGQNLFQLQYRNAKNNTTPSLNKLRTLAFISVCLPWFWERVFRKLLFSVTSGTLKYKITDFSYSIEEKCNVIYKIFTLINFCIFLQKSIYPSVVERFLKVRPLYTAPQDIRRIMDDNVHRELLWFGISEFLGFTLPLINLHKIKGFAKRAFFSRSLKLSNRHFLQTNICAICGSIPNFPHGIGCSHVFCYYCIASMVMADPQYLCFDCDVKADGYDSIKPLPSNQLTN